MKKFLFILLLFAQNTVWAQSPIEQGILLFNQKEYQQAEEILQQQSNDGSAYATFWLGVVQYKNRKHFQAGDTFLKAAQMGDPWAMGVLAGSTLNANSPCNYLGWPCDSKWKDKAFEGWRYQADNGNGKAILALRVKKSYLWELIPFYRSYHSEAIFYDAFQKGSQHAILKMDGWVSDEKYVRYLKLAAEQGYAPAMESLYYHMNIIGFDEAMKWINKAIELGYAEAARTLYYTYSQGKKNHSGDIIIHRDPRKAYYYNRLSGALGGEEEEASRITQKMRVKDNRAVTDENGRPVFDILISEQEQAEMDKQVAEFVKDIKPNMFLDETSIDLF